MSEKSEIRIAPFDSLKFIPRFEYGEMAQAAELCGSNDGTELGVGWGRMTDAKIPWTIQYDEVLTVVEGSLRIHAQGEIYQLAEKDSIWLPAGTELVYETESALIHYAIHPANWHENQD